MVSVSDTVTTQGIHVTAQDEVTVYGLNRVVATTDAHLGLPTDILGTEYLTLGYENTNIVNATLFGLVATQERDDGHDHAVGEHGRPRRGRAL